MNPILLFKKNKKNQGTTIKKIKKDLLLKKSCEHLCALGFCLILFVVYLVWELRGFVLNFILFIFRSCNCERKGKVAENTKKRVSEWPIFVNRFHLTMRVLFKSFLFIILLKKSRSHFKKWIKMIFHL